MKTPSIQDKIIDSGNFKKKFPTIFIHLFIWVALFALPLLFRPHYSQGPNTTPIPFHIPMPIWMNNLFMVIAFYTNILVLMPRFFNKKKWGYYLLFTCIFLIGSYFIPLIASKLDNFYCQHMAHEFGRRSIPPKGFEFKQFSFIFMFFLVWASSLAYSLFIKLQESVRHADKVYATALQSELSFLKAQINPHFLFNTLNNIYVLTLKKSEAAPLAVMKLSNLMRKITSDTGVDFVPFEDEASFIRDYIELQELRLTAKTNIKYEIEGNFDLLQIAPRILIPFIDNAFKYGVSNRKESEILIRFEFQNKKLRFIIQNAIHPTLGESLESSGVGLENAKRRLNLLYKDRYSLNITETPESYHVLLEIELT